MSDINLSGTVKAAESGISLPTAKPSDLAKQGVEPSSVKSGEAKLAEKSAEQEASQQKMSDPEAMQDVVAKLNDHVQNIERKLDFQMDEDSGRTVVKVFDKETEELIRQIPNEEALELARNLSDQEPLGLFSAQV